MPFLPPSNSSISVEDFSGKLIDIAANTIPTSKPSVRKRNTIWYNDECKEARSTRKKALQKVISSPTDDNIQCYKIIWAKTRKTMKTARCQSWQRFVSSINSRTSLKKVWNIVNKISRKRPAIEVKHLQDGDKEVTSLADIADTLAEYFSEISFSHHYNAKF